MRQAKDIMTSAVISVSPDSSFNEAIEMIIANRISGLPVVNDAGQLVGVLSEADRLKLMADTEAPGDNARVADYMTRSVISVEPDAGLTVIADRLMRCGIRRVPVVANGSVIGIISRHDLMRAMYEDEAVALPQSDVVMS